MIDGKYDKNTVVSCAFTHIDVSQHDVSEVMRDIKNKFSAEISVFRFDPRDRKHAESLVELIGKKIISNENSNYDSLTIKRVEEI